MGDLGSVSVGLALLLSSVYIMYKLVRKQMQGKGCSGCSGCSHAQSCSLYKQEEAEHK